MTLTEKILTAHTDREKVSPGEFINVKVDLILSNDITAPIAIREFRRIGVDKVFDPAKIVMVADHFVPNKDIASAENTIVTLLTILNEPRDHSIWLSDAYEGNGEASKLYTKKSGRSSSTETLIKLTLPVLVTIILNWRLSPTSATTLSSHC